jgi:hypothetical protein
MKSGKNILEYQHATVVKKTLSTLALFYPGLYVLENLLKDGFEQVFQKNHGDNWLKSSELLRIKPFREEADIILKRKPQGFVIKEKYFMQEAGFGFWVELFGPENYKQLQGVPIKIFNNLPKNTKRNSLYRMLGQIKEFRNNLYHHRFYISAEYKNYTAKTDYLNLMMHHITFLLESFAPKYVKLINPKKIEKSIMALQKQILKNA